MQPSSHQTNLQTSITLLSKVCLISCNNIEVNQNENYQMFVLVLHATSYSGTIRIPTFAERNPLSEINKIDQPYSIINFKHKHEQLIETKHLQ
jgi:hypothetical protein